MSSTLEGSLAYLKDRFNCKYFILLMAELQDCGTGSDSKVKWGNANTNFDLSGLLPPTNGQHAQCLCCRIQ